MDSIRVSEAPDPGSIPGEATNFLFGFEKKILPFSSFTNQSQKSFLGTKSCNIAGKYFYSNRQKYYAKKFPDHNQSAWIQCFLNPVQRPQDNIDDNEIDNNSNQNIYVVVIGF